MEKNHDGGRISSNFERKYHKKSDQIDFLPKFSTILPPCQFGERENIPPPRLPPLLAGVGGGGDQLSFAQLRSNDNIYLVPRAVMRYGANRLRYQINSAARLRLNVKRFITFY